MITKDFLGSTELEVTNIGFGAYRVDARVKTHEQALSYALDEGINLIDTSSNYTHGYSEKLVGKVINEKIKNKQIKRKDLVVLSKAGYAQGQTLEELKKNNTDEHGLALVKVSEHHWHCLSPAFIEKQIDQSLERMQLDQIDVYLLHNPEYLLPDLGDDKFYSVIELAFAALEKAVADNKIKYYGISSNTFALNENNVSLDKVWECAQNVNRNNHFRVVEFPLNLFESSAAIDESINLLEKAQMYGLGTLANRPLNAFTPSKELFRLATFKVTKDEASLDKELDKKLNALVQWEKEFNQMPLDETVQPFFLGHVLLAQKENINDLFQWQELYRFQIHPLLENTIKQLSKIDEVRTWLDEYITQAMNLVQTYSNSLEHKTAQKSEAVSRWLDAQNEELKSYKILSQKVLAIYQSLSDVSSILIGMREKRYVEDSLKARAVLSDKEAKETLKNFSALSR